MPNPLPSPPPLSIETLIGMLKDGKTKAVRDALLYGARDGKDGQAHGQDNGATHGEGEAVRTKQFAQLGSEDYMTVADVRHLVNAVQFAESIRRPILVMASIRWDLAAGFEWSRWPEIQTATFERLGKWHARHNLPPTYAWVREIGREGSPHTHVLMHLPCELWGECRDYLVTSGGFAPDGADLPIHLSGGDYGTKTAAMRAGAMRYLIKTLPPDATMRDGDRRLAPAWRALGLKLTQHPPDPIPGRHVGVSRTLDRGARAAAHWRELHTVAELRRVLHP